MKHARRRSRVRGLQARLLFWFIGAILLAVGASVVTTMMTSTDNGDYPTRVVSRHVQQRVSRLWDDPQATDAYVAQLREDTGLDIRVRRDPSVFPKSRGPRGGAGGGMIWEDGVAYVPITKRGTVVGALEIKTGAQAPQAWRIVVAIVAALLVLGFFARRVSMRLARPLEHVAAAAERFGGGDLGARTGVDRMPRRWVAEEVRDVGRAFDGMADRISRVVLDQRELLAAISHELRSPLGRARVALEIARERSETSPAPLGRSLDDVDRQLVEVDAILGDLLASARAGLADLRKERIALGPWLEQRAAAEALGPIEVRSPKEAIEVSVDGALLGRVVHNLFANAWAHGHPKETPLVVEVTATKDQVRVLVRDRGPGIAEDLLGRLFDPFVTGTGKARSPGQHGIGLGLTLVRRIVEAHGGTVSAANAEDGGARIGFALPRTDLAAQPPVDTMEQ